MSFPSCFPLRQRLLSHLEVVAAKIEGVA